MQSKILYGDKLKQALLKAKTEGYAIPAINVSSSSTIIATLEAASKVNSPIFVQFSVGGSKAFKGLGVDNLESNVLGAVSGAKLVHQLANIYNVDVIIHTDHCKKEHIDWLKGIIKYSKEFFNENGYPLFSSHMLDYSLETIEDNINESVNILNEIKDIGAFLEVEIGVAGEEDKLVSLNNQININNLGDNVYSNPNDVLKMFNALKGVSDNFLIAAIFGNLHGVFSEGVQKLKPEILKDIQDLVSSNLSNSGNINNPVNLVFHGTSGTPFNEVSDTLKYGIIKVNLDTDLQWVYWMGVKTYIEKNNQYLQSMIGSIDDKNSSNKEYFDPRHWIRHGEESMRDRIIKWFEVLNCINRS